MPSASDDIGGVSYPREKIVWGADGVAIDVDTAAGKALPVQVASPLGLNPLGEPTDPKSAATDGSAVTVISLLKQISANGQAPLPAGSNVIGHVIVDGTGGGTGGTQLVQDAAVLAAITQSSLPVSLGSSFGAGRVVLGTDLIPFHLVSAASTNPTVVKASSGYLYGWLLYNANASARKLVFHNKATAPTAGASVFFSVMVPPGWSVPMTFAQGIPFSLGIAITTVTGLADSNAVAVSLNDLTINLFYA